MDTLLVFVAAGFVASLINGSLGMGYGALTATGLLLLGVPPASASAAVHFSQVGTALASGVAHWRFRNIDWRTVGVLAVPGALGAAVGAYVLVRLSEFSMDSARLWIGSILLLLGLYVLVRFAFLRLGKLVSQKRPAARFFGPLGLVAGFVNSTSGGGWGPMATATLLSSGRLEPRKIVGSVSSAEFSVALAASITFFFALAGFGGVDLRVVAGLLIGGVAAAPFAAWLAQRIPPRILGAAAGGLIVIVNARLLLSVVDVGPVLATGIYVALGALWLAGVTASVRSVRAEARMRAALEADIVAPERRPQRP